MLTQAVAAVARDTVRVVDTVWVADSGSGFVDSVVAWSTIVVGAAAVVALVLPILERRRERASVDAAISVDAYAVRRILRGWLIPLEHMRAAGEPPTLERVGRRREEPKEVEDRLQRAVMDAPHASTPVASAIREAYVLYCRVAAAPPLEKIDSQGRPVGNEVRDAAIFADLQACAARLTDAVEPALRDK